MEELSSSANKVRLPDPTDGDSIPVGRGTLHHRVIIAVDLLFVVTMAVFVTASFFSEKERHFQQTFEHLDETLGVLSAALLMEKGPSNEGLLKVEKRLEMKTGVAHLAFLVGPNNVVMSCSNPDLIGRTFKQIFDLEPYGRAMRDWASAEGEGHRWLLSSTPHPEGDVLVLMRSRSDSEQFVGKFLALHGVHMAVTLVLFTVVLHLIGRRYLRIPIERLVAYLQKLESGDFRAVPEVLRDDELGWLARRFTQMAVRLKEVVQRLVRAEKYATANVMVFRIAREMRQPLESLNRHIIFLEGLAESDKEIRKLGNTLRADRQKVVDVIRRLSEIEPPDEQVKETV